MNKFISRLLAAAVLTAGLAGVNSAHAVWTFTGANTNTNSTSAPNLTSMAGYYTANNASNVVNGNWVSNSASALQFYSSGLGMCSDPDNTSTTPASCNSPNHAIDNAKNTEAVLVGFSSSVVLSSIGLGYAVNAAGTSTSVDVSLFRWVGAAATPTLANLSATSMTGWELVGNYGDLTAGGANTVNSTGAGSSWWLVSAYNSGFSGAKETRGDLDNGNDYFKLLSLNGSSCTSSANGVCSAPRANGVPEPASLALVAMALLGVYGTRRRTDARG